MNLKSSYKPLLLALVSIFYCASVGTTADIVTKDGNPSNYTTVPDLKTLQTRLNQDQALAAQGQLTETDILKDNAHGAVVVSAPALLRNGDPATVDSTARIAQVGTANSAGQSTLAAAATLSPYQSCSAIGRPGVYQDVCWTEQYAEVCDPSTGHCRQDPFADLPGVWDCSRCNVALDKGLTPNQVTYNGLVYLIFNKTCDYSPSSLDPRCPDPLDPRPKPSGPASQIVGTRFWGNKDGSDYLELYGNFQSASDVTFSCGSDLSTPFDITSPGTTQVNIKISASLTGKTCWIGTKQSPQQQLVQIPPAGPYAAYFVSGVLRDKSGTPISHAKVVLHYTDFIGAQSGDYGTTTTDDQGRYVVPANNALTGPRGGGGVYQLFAYDSTNNQIGSLSYYDIPQTLRDRMQQDGFVYIDGLLKPSN
jgi:hypothetical protein